MKTLFKKRTTLEDGIAPDAKYFHRVQTAGVFSDASREPHYAVAESRAFERNFTRGYEDRYQAS